ncbi:MAG: amidohydrolase family protein [Burkholderiales bacterium]
MPADLPICPAPGPVCAPRTKAPAGAADCHFHIFGRQERYPLSPQTRYVPAEASVEVYLALAHTLGIGRMVVVQPSPYGTDNRCTLDVIRTFGLERARGVAVAGLDVSTAQLKEMHDGGIRGIRINAVTGGVPLSELEGLAQRIAPLGWHLQLFVTPSSLIRLEPALRQLTLPVVIDHMGHVPASQGTGSAR